MHKHAAMPSDPTLEPVALETAIGYTFRDPQLLASALTHPSYRHEHDDVKDDFQRLEFLGDAVLGLLTAEYVFRQHEADDEGLLTVLRSQCTSGRALAAVAAEIDLGARLRLGRGDERQLRRQQGRILADAMEAVMGAVWLDGGHAGAAAVFERVFVPRMSRLSQSLWAHNPKGELQDLAQRRYQCLPLYVVESSGGPEHAPRYVVSVTVDGRRALGEGGSKRMAESAAARALLTAMGAQ
ncbi:MAG: ribonuclease III [Kiritimatiellae bacterium]|nr:ribonuclease III [Kiritimatiellia bacterium]